VTSTASGLMTKGELFLNGMMETQAMLQ
jgi:hypothetical protein